MICDFCGLTAKWEFLDAHRAGAPSSLGWAACTPCKIMAENGQAEDLVEQAMAVTLQDMRVSPSLRALLSEQIVQLHEEFHSRATSSLPRRAVRLEYLDV